MNQWSIILPYYNEEKFLQGTLESLCLQHYKDFVLILVNNASNDKSEQRAKELLGHYPHVKTLFINENRPGKTYAQQTALKLVETPYVATVDADTYYPPYYIYFCNYILEHYPQYVSVMACDIYHPYNNEISRQRCRKIKFKSLLRRKQCHAGGYAQTFRTSALKKVGGFDPSRWPYVLEDHEIVHRILKIGKIYHSDKHWCMPSPRRINRGKVSWSMLERKLYAYTPFFLKDWFFYCFLKNRFIKRNATIACLRSHPWESK
ncbi:hypothetical protein COMNV_00009 [Commensalibacter sp. Nvir]|uniref:glycosyltransferase family 2 protein n=1 Tax=Commensalibacter sp. Nvir TaxID=3069817 RepID=UPI002D713287|nr:hypothetical protein COMNV_00009 [Commensalibacter sp. Nvir]